MEHHQNAPEMAPQVVGQLFGVHLPIFNFTFYGHKKTTPNLQNFLFPSILLILLGKLFM